MARSRTHAAAALAAALLTLTGCYGDKPAADEQAPTGLALLRAEPAESVETAATTSGKAKSVKVALDGTVNGRTIESTGVVAFNPLAAELVTPGPAATPVTIRLVGTAAYAQIPEQFRDRAGGKGWLKADLVTVAPLIGLDPDEITSNLQNVDPSAHAKALLAGGDLKVVGEETVDGVKTVHYSGTTPVAKYLENVTPEARDAVERRLTKLGVSEVKTDLWVDESYQVRKAKAVLGSHDLTMRFTDYDQPVDVAAPPASDTADLAALLGNR
jgi:hypothetical protein